MEYQSTYTTYPRLVERAISNDESAQRFSHLTGLSEKAYPMEIKMVNWVSTLILDKAFCDEPNDVGISNLLHMIRMEVEGKDELKVPLETYKTTSNRFISKLLPGVKDYLIEIYNSEYLANGYFKPKARVTNLRLSGIWYIFATEQLEKYYVSVRYSPNIYTGKFLEISERFIRKPKLEG